MAGNAEDLADKKPFEVLKSADETGGEFARYVTTHHPAPGAQSSETDLSHPRWVADNADEHVHPNHEETYRVRSGQYRVIFEDTDRTLSEGEEITLPRGVPHRHFNPAGRPARVVKEDRPARHSEEFVTALYKLAMAGKTDEEGFPSFLQFAVLQDAYPGYAYTTDLPIGVQKRLVKVLAPIGRLLGYRADPFPEMRL